MNFSKIMDLLLIYIIYGWERVVLKDIFVREIVVLVEI